MKVSELIEKLKTYPDLYSIILSTSNGNQYDVDIIEKWDKSSTIVINGYAIYIEDFPIKKIENENKEGDLLVMQKEEYDDPLNYIQIELLGHCGCGRPQDSLPFIKKFLNHLSIRRDIDRDNYGSYEEYSGDLDKWWAILDSYFYNDSGLEYTFFYMLDKYGITEHGGSVPGWLESKGDILLEELNKIDFDNIED